MTFKTHKLQTDPHRVQTDPHRVLQFGKQLQLGLGAQSPFVEDPSIASFDYFTIHIIDPAPIGIDDEFTTTQINRNLWLIHNEHPELWSLSGGALHIQSEEGDIWRFRRNARNIFLQKAPDGDFSIKTKVTISPEKNYEQAMLLVWADHNNYIKLSTLYDNGLKFEAASESAGDYNSYFMNNAIGGAVSLRIDKTGNHFDFYIGANEEDYAIFGGGYDNPMNPYGFPIKIGLGAISPESGQIRTASFDFFRVEKSQVEPTPTPTRIPLKFMLLY